MQLVYVHRFSSATNVSRVVARVAEGGFYFNPSSNVAFNVTAIVRWATYSFNLNYCEHYNEFVRGGMDT
jgi:hypothetical protein